MPTARKYRLEHPEFARDLKRARHYFAESMEYELTKQARGESKGSFLSTIARLKATRRKMREAYSEKVADTRILALQVNVNGAPAALSDPAAYLRECLAESTPATRALLAAPERSDAAEEAEIVGAAEPRETGEP